MPTETKPCLDDLIAAMRRRPDWRVVEDATDRYRRWWLEIEDLLRRCEA